MDMKYIAISNANKRQLRANHGVSVVAVWKALNFKSDSARSQAIRKEALEQMGGRVIIEMDITDGYQPNCQTVFEHDSNGVSAVRSTFTNGVEVLLDCLEDSATLTMNGAEIQRYWNVGGMYAKVLFEAEQLASHQS